MRMLIAALFKKPKHGKNKSPPTVEIINRLL